MPDPDNLLKLFLDACTRARIIVDDSQDWCQWSRPVLVRGTPAEAIITVTDLEFRPPCKPEDDPHTRRLLAAFKRKYASVPKPPKKVCPRGQTPDPGAHPDPIPPAGGARRE